MKTTTINGKRYTFHADKFLPGRVILKGPGLLIGAYLPEGTTLDSPNLREEARKAYDAARAAARKASEGIQQAVREGRAGLGHDLPEQDEISEEEQLRHELDGGFRDEIKGNVKKFGVG